MALRFPSGKLHISSLRFARNVQTRRRSILQVYSLGLVQVPQIYYSAEVLQSSSLKKRPSAALSSAITCQELV